MTVKVVFNDDSSRIFYDCSRNTLELIKEIFNVKSISVLG